MDIRPMEPCPVGSKGRHALLGAIVSVDGDPVMTLHCERCGALRRVPVTGEVRALDDQPAEVIRLVAGIAGRTRL